ncbi:MAG: cytochrome P450 [Proteobacteria bacterium]|nr:cytochrome P450 [Pseudomonadota bacterium]HQR03470.1 cytochrome P450 [Rhodocyclaceae bacterium]
MTATLSGRVTLDDSIFNPEDHAFIRDPYPTFRRLHAGYPVAWHDRLQAWFVSSHELAAAALRDTEHLSIRIDDWEYAPPNYGQKAESEKTGFDRMWEHSLWTIPRDKHIRLRRLAMPAFSRTVMEKIEVRIKDLVNKVFDDIGQADEIEAYSQIGRLIPAAAIARMVGIPRENEAVFEGLAWHMAEAQSPNLSQAERDAAMARVLPGFEMLEALVREYRAMKDPGDGFLGQLVKAQDGDARLSDWDIISLVSAVLVAGADTSIDLHTLALRALLGNPEQKALLREKPELGDAFLLESLRQGVPGKSGLHRYALSDFELGGQRIRKGQRVCPFYSAANVDPQQYPDPERFDMSRSHEGNILFGAGPHFCIGNMLARVQGLLMIREFMARFPDAELVDGTGDIDYDYHHHNARRITRLRIKTNIH